MMYPLFEYTRSLVFFMISGQTTCAFYAVHDPECLNYYELCDRMNITHHTHACMHAHILVIVGVTMKK